MRSKYIKRCAKLEPIDVGYYDKDDNYIQVNKYIKCPLCDCDEFNIRQLLSVSKGEYRGETVFNSVKISGEDSCECDMDELYTHECDRCGNILLFSRDMSE